MRLRDIPVSRRGVLGLMAVGVMSFGVSLRANARPAMIVHKYPNCGCCSAWVKHLEQAGFPVSIVDTANLPAVKQRLGVPDELSSCHTAEMEGYLLEGHVPVAAILLLLAERPRATGLAVPGMPIGAPGMEGGAPEIYEVVLFAPEGRRSYGRFRGDQAV